MISLSSAAQTLIIGQFAEKDSKVLKRCEVVISAVYAQLNIQIKLVSFPGRRALDFANKGKTDGELCRIGNIAVQYLNLIKVTPALTTMELVAISKDIHLSIKTTADLQGLKLVSIRGLKAVENDFKSFAVSYVSDFAVIAKLLESGRADVAIVPKMIIEKPLKGQIVSFKVHQPSLVQYSVFHYIHKRHKALAPQISAQIIRFKKAQQANAEPN
jgi:polar amino acid transport system substrate-binding protein